MLTAPTPTTAKRAWRETRRRVGREQADLLLRRAAFLPQLERLLIEQAVGQGVTPKALALLQNVPVWQMRRRLRRLRDLLCDPCFVLATQFLDRLPTALRPLADSYFVKSRTLRQCATEHRLTLHEVRQDLVRIRILLATAAQAGTLPENDTLLP